MKFLKHGLAAAVAVFAAQAHAGFDYSVSAVPGGSFTAPTFSDGVNASVQSTSLSNFYLQPAGTSGDYLVVSSAGSATVETGGVSSYSFVWGSPDTFNTVEIFSGGSATTFSGTDFAAEFGLTANGSNSNTRLFTITGTDGSTIDKIVFGSTGIAFEVSVAAVPEPETYALMLAGLGVIGFMARRRKV